MERPVKQPNTFSWYQYGTGTGASISTGTVIGTSTGTGTGTGTGQNLEYVIYISQLVRYARICNNKSDFKTKHKHLLSKLEKQGFKKILEKSFAKFYRSHYDKVRKYGASIKELREP